MSAFLRLLELCRLTPFVAWFGVDYTITATSIVQTSGTPKLGTALETITAGQALYSDGTSGFYGPSVGLADANAAGKKTVIGISTCGASVGQAVSYADGFATITFGATFTQGDVVLLSRNPGKLCPSADATSGDDIDIIGVAGSTSVLKCLFYNSGVAK